MMWDRAAEQVTDRGGTIVMHATAEVIRHDAGKVTEIVVRTAEGEMTMPASGGVISSMPLGHLVNALEPAPPADVLEAASTLTHRDFLTVAITVPEDAAFPDNWIYIHEPAVEVGRVQNFGAWSPDMVEPGTTCLGLEYFVQEGDQLWTKADTDLIEMARRELEYLGLADTEQMGGGWVVRMPKAYPVYDADYGAAIERIGKWLAEEVPMVQPVGRNGMHRYNNQDHSMLTAMLAVENLHGADNDLWAVNVDDDYHEEIVE